MDSQPIGLYRTAGTLASMIMRVWIRHHKLLGYKTSSCWRFIPTGINWNQSNTDQRRKTGSRPHHLDYPEKGEVMVMHVQDYNVLKDKTIKRDTQIIPFATSAGTEHDLDSITAQEFIWEQYEDSRFCQASFLVKFLGSPYNYDKNRLLT